MDNDFIEVCNRVFYLLKIDEKKKKVEGDEYITEGNDDEAPFSERVHEMLLYSLMDNCYHEIIMNYHTFLTILPLDQLSATAIQSILPPS